MIPNVKDRVVESQGVTSTGEFGISYADSAHIMTILRDTLYSDKILAILREYGSNAWDAHRMVGKFDLPIKVVLPTVSDPSLTIRDFGPGLSKDDVFQIFTQYGASTKRNSDNAVGMLGIGSKSGFAYSDSFTVVSYNGGTKSSYVAVLDASEKGVINLLNEEPCGEETGVMIQIAVRPQDIHQFEETAKKLYRYFKPMPDINIDLPELPPSQATLTKGVIYSPTGNYHEDQQKKWYAVMGCVSYLIDLDQLEDSQGNRTAPDAIWDLSGALFFDIGEVQISASREVLKYSDATKAIISQRFAEMIDEYVQQTIDAITSTKLNPWEQRVRLQVLHRLDLPIPPAWEELAKQKIDLTDEDLKMPKTFSFTQSGRKESRSISIDETTRLVLKDDPRPLEAFMLKSGDYLIRRLEQAEWKAVEKELHKFCAKIGIDGVPIIHLTDVAKSVRYVAKVPLERLKGKSFLFTPKESRGFYAPYSPHWVPAAHTPTADDIFVVIRKFQPNFYGFFELWKQDKDLAMAFGFPMPDIIGYRTTKKNPIEEAIVPGQSYQKWSQAMRETISKRPEFIEYLKMCQLSYKVGGHDFFNRGNYVLKAKSLVRKFGEKHVISDVILKRLIVKDYFKELKDHKLMHAFDVLKQGRNLGSRRPELDSIKETYRLLKGHDPIGQILEDQSTGHWIKYINAVDYKAPRKRS